jgi:hypothetical protein
MITAMINCLRSIEDWNGFLVFRAEVTRRDVAHGTTGYRVCARPSGATVHPMEKTQLETSRTVINAVSQAGRRSGVH